MIFRVSEKYVSHGCCVFLRLFGVALYLVPFRLSAFSIYLLCVSHTKLLLFSLLFVYVCKLFCFFVVFLRRMYLFVSLRFGGIAPFCFSASSCMAFHVHYLSASGEYRILLNLIYTMYISRDFPNSSFPSCFPSGAKACLLPASRDIIPFHPQAAVLAACCSRWGGYNPRHARKI